jgi:hypothetical protein
MRPALFKYWREINELCPHLEELLISHLLVGRCSVDLLNYNEVARLNNVRCFCLCEEFAEFIKTIIIGESTDVTIFAIEKEAYDQQVRLFFG